MMHIVYRCCNKELENPPKREGRPKWFSKMNCFKSLHDSYTNSKFKNDIKITILMQDNGEPPSDLFDTIENCGYKITSNKGSSDSDSKKIQLDFYETDIKSNNDDVYFLEDDYLHTIDALDCIYVGMKTFGLVTGFDCMDRYTRDDDITSGKDFIYFVEGRHWRTAESTTNTWAATSKMMQSVLPYSKYYGIGDRIMFRHMFNNEGIRIHQPMCGVSTHVHDGLMSPGVDWELVNNESSVVRQKFKT